MNLHGIRVGDIVEVDIQGRRFFAKVTAKDATGLGISPLCRETWRHAKAAQVIGHYRRSKQGPRQKQALADTEGAKD